MATFQNPHNGYQEDVPMMSWFYTMLFGGLYFMVRGVWSHAAALTLIPLFLFATMGFFALFIVIPMWLSYIVFTPSILRQSYLRKGWKQL